MNRPRPVEAVASALVLAVVFAAMALVRALFRSAVPLHGVPPPGRWDFVVFPAITFGLVFVVVFAGGMAGLSIQRPARGRVTVRHYVVAVVVLLALAAVALGIYSVAR